jgi:hypothetical protein
MRHSYATHLVENGTNLIKVKELLGHDKLETTMLYVHLASKDIFNIKSPIDTNWEETEIDKDISNRNNLSEQTNLEDNNK